MKLNIDFDCAEVAKQIAEEVIKALEPLFNKSRENDCLFSVETLAEYLGVSDQWVYDRVKFKEIPYLKVGKFLKFRKKDIDRWLDTKNVPVVNPCSAKLKRFK